ncbi:MAG: [FeFe] hydrogenase H-cluster radical SAM maturase HydE [Thermoguttaceae bacterium]|nr:[FeFe] hydrogenase H-cluster radical SAM maturase HydE [Thermoguttaceae bacterium]
MTTREIADWLRETDEEKLRELWDVADKTRRECVGDAVWLRGLAEISNHCRRNCLYCGVRAARKIERYRLTRDEILEAAALAEKFQFGTLVLQSGEDFEFDEIFVADLIREIRERFGLAITLSLGERKDSEWIRWKEAGAARYLLRFETSNPALYKAIHPLAPDSVHPDRIALLRRLREIGYEIGSGVMIGAPGQNFDDLARDLSLFRELDLDMIGCGPFLPHPATPLGRLENVGGVWRSKPAEEPENPGPTNIAFEYPVQADQVPNTNEMAFKVVALSRILCPYANIPSTTAVATIDGKGGRKGALERGANVVMPNLTPQKDRELYEIYPNKAATFEDAETTRATALRQIAEIGRIQGIGAGTSRRFAARNDDLRRD